MDHQPSIPRSHGLSDQLEAYSATARSHSAVWKRRVRRWTPYAAAIGSSLALTTAADAAVIYSGPLNSTVTVRNGTIVTSPPPTYGYNYARAAAAGIVRNDVFGTAPSAKTVKFGPANFSQQALFFANPGNSTGRVRLIPTAAHEGLLFSSKGVKRLSSGQKISAGAGMFGQASVFNPAGVPGQANYPNLASGVRFGGLRGPTSNGKFFQSFHGTTLNGNFKPLPATGFVGFSFASGSQTDYGWIRLQVTDTDGSNLPNTLEVVDLAYDDSGAAIFAGAEVAAPAVPEPSSAALALLAAGATGVLVWRKRRAAAGCAA